MSDDRREGVRRDEGEGGQGDMPLLPRRPNEDADAPLPLPGRVRPPGEPSVPLPGERHPTLPRPPEDEPPRAAGAENVPLPRAPRQIPGEGEPVEHLPLPGEARSPELSPPPPEPLRGPPRWVRPAMPPLPGPAATRPAPAAEPPPERPAAPPAPAAPEPPPPRPPKPASELDVAGLAAAARARSDEEERSYRSLVEDVEGYLEQGYDLFGLVGYPRSGKSHALQALSKIMHGFEAPARARFRQERAPGPSERWPFYYAFDDGRRKWVFMDVGGELFAMLHSNDWTESEATAGLLHTVAHCRGLLLMLHLQPGHLRHGATGFAARMSEAERQAEGKAQKAQEELEFFDQFLLFARALRAERGDLAALLERAAAAPLAETLRGYQASPRLDLPVAVLFTQADRLLDGRDFGAGDDEYVNPLTIEGGVAPFVGRHLPSLLGSLLRHARRFRFDFAQSYVEGPGPGDGEPIWAYRNEPLSVGLLPAVEFLERNLPPKDGRRPWPRAIETRTALKLHRLLHPRAWRDVEVEL